MQSTLSFPLAALSFSRFARFPLVTLDFLEFRGQPPSEPAIFSARSASTSAEITASRSPSMT